MSVLLFAESSNGVFKKPTLEAASYGFQLAKSLGTHLVAVSMGNVSNEQLEVLSKYGVSKVYTISSLDSFSGPAYASAIAEVAKASSSNVVVMSQTYNGRAVAPRVAVKLNAALFSGVSGMVQAKGSGFEVSRTAYSLKALQQTSTSKSNLVITLKNNAYKLEINETASNVEAFSFSPSVNDLKLKSIGVEKASSKISAERFTTTQPKQSRLKQTKFREQQK